MSNKQFDYEKAWNDLKNKIDNAQKYFNKREEKSKDRHEREIFNLKSTGISLIEQYMFDIEAEQIYSK